jgi:hypothetical protein
VNPLLESNSFFTGPYRGGQKNNGFGQNRNFTASLCAQYNLFKRTYRMRKVVILLRHKKCWHESPDVDLLNAQITEIENDG